MKYYVALVIRKDNQFLVVNHIKKSEHPWRFPGGKVEPGELPIVAAARELQEELGVEALSLQLVGTPIINVDGDDWCGYFFLADLLVGTPEIKEPSKHGELKFMSRFDLKINDCSPESDVADGVGYKFDNPWNKALLECVLEVRSC